MVSGGFLCPRPMTLRLLLTLLALSAASAAAGWRPLDTDARVHQATLSGWTLTVDASRARLTSLVPPGGAPDDNILLGGGHRVWLGPQSEWPVFWPPPKDWEDGAAASVTLSDDATTLTLVLPRTDPRQPALTRRYVLKPDALLLVAAWRIDESTTPRASRQAIHILQTRPDTAAFLTPRPTPEAPLGHGLLALAVRPGTLLDRPIPTGFLAPLTPACPAPDLLRLAGTGEEEKIGVPPQPLVARFAGGHGLRLLPALHDGVEDATLPPPEAGLFTQVYFGATAWAMTELEQLSPRLLPTPGSDTVSATMRLEFIPREP
jgi:hypothetical protein